MRDQLKSIDRSNSLNGGRASLKFREYFIEQGCLVSIYNTHRRDVVVTDGKQRKTGQWSGNEAIGHHCRLASSWFDNL